MTDPAPLRGPGLGPRDVRWVRFLAVLFSVAAAVSLVLVAVDVFIGRHVAGDLFSAGLNALAAVVLWRVLGKKSGA